MVKQKVVADENTYSKTRAEGMITSIALRKLTDPNKAAKGGESLLLEIDTDHGNRKVFLGLGNYAYNEETAENPDKYYGWKQIEGADGELVWKAPSIGEANSLFALFQSIGGEIEFDIDEREDAKDDFEAPIEINEVTFSPDIEGAHIVIDVRTSPNKKKPGETNENWAVKSLEFPEKKAKSSKSPAPKTEAPKTKTTASPVDDTALTAQAYVDFKDYLAYYSANKKPTSFNIAKLANAMDEFQWSSNKTKRYVNTNMPEMLVTGKANGWITTDTKDASKSVYVAPADDDVPEDEE